MNPDADNRHVVGAHVEKPALHIVKTLPAGVQSPVGDGAAHAGPLCAFSIFVPNLLGGGRTSAAARVINQIFLQWL